MGDRPVPANRRPVRRVALVAMLNSEERDKIVMILQELRSAGYQSVLFDADLIGRGSLIFATGEARTGVARIGGSGFSYRLQALTGWSRAENGELARIEAEGVHLVTALPPSAVAELAGAGGLFGPDTIGDIPVDTVWVDCLDIDRRMEFEPLYRQLAIARLAPLAPGWSSVLDATLKDRTLSALTTASPPIPCPETRIVTATWSRSRLAAVRRLLPGDLWVKVPDATHGRGLRFVRTGEGVEAAVSDLLRRTPHRRCLVQEDVRSLVVDRQNRLFRADLAVTVLDGAPLLATLRVQAALGAPTNSAHGGRSVAVDATRLPAGVVDLARRAMSAVGLRYGSVDVLGGLFDCAGFRVVESRDPVVCEVNLLPGGRSPGFQSSVVRALVRAGVEDPPGRL